MYQYSLVDKTLVNQRVEQYRHQLTRHLNGELDDETFRPLRLMNGLYIQRHAPMLRVSIPYGTLSTRQFRKLSEIARVYDKGFGHFTTRQNIQYNWPTLESTADILAALAEVDMHAIQTSGNCIRNITCDPFAGIHPDETEDPRIFCEIVRQWATLHPEFSYLPRKFKIAITSEGRDRVALKFHDIGLKMLRREGVVGFEVWVGGGLGRTPIVGKLISPFVQASLLLRYLDAVLRVYNLHGRRDNKYKARIKILVQQMGEQAFRDEVEDEFAYNQTPELDLSEDKIAEIRARFVYPDYAKAVVADLSEQVLDADESAAYQRWLDNVVSQHQHPDFATVQISLKQPGNAPGDITCEQMDGLADLADQFSFGELRTTIRQNLMLPHVHRSQLVALWRKLRRLNLAVANIGKATDMIVCPGLDFCSLANAHSIPVAAAIYQQIEPLVESASLGDLKIHFSGCMNACAHHHIGHIGILGVDKKGREFYQITLGGDASDSYSDTGKIIGPSVARDDVPQLIERILLHFIDVREAGERFVDTCHRVGVESFKEVVYAA